MRWKKRKISRHETLLKTAVITAGCQVCHQTKRHLSYMQDYKQSIRISGAPVGFIIPYPAMGEGGDGGLTLGVHMSLARSIVCRQQFRTQGPKILNKMAKTGVK